VQVGAHALDEEGPQRVVELGQARGAHVAAHRLADAGELLRRVEVGDLAARQHPVDVLEEARLDHLRVVEEEHRRRLLRARQVVELLQVLAEELRFVPADHLDHEQLEVADVRRQSCQRLAARAAHADEHRVAARHGDDALDAADVADRVDKEHEIHRLHAALEVVLLELILD